MHIRLHVEDGSSCHSLVQECHPEQRQACIAAHGVVQLSCLATPQQHWQWMFMAVAQINRGGNAAAQVNLTSQCRLQEQLQSYLCACLLKTSQN